ncbi:hypothetical protein GCM10010301_68040 [Streptomyces plicatus]|nr:hypothetical protein GCM10010301_68040 [Streptomyces plicatus]
MADRFRAVPRTDTPRRGPVPPHNGSRYAHPHRSRSGAAGIPAHQAAQAAAGIPAHQAAQAAAGIPAPPPEAPAGTPAQPPEAPAYEWPPRHTPSPMPSLSD